MKISTLQLFALALSLLFTTSAHAYLSMAESGEILPMNLYQVGLEPQFLLNNGSGANLNAFFDAPLNDSTSGRISMGAGKIDFSTMASIKYIPFPDVDNQPAMGLRVGLGYTRVSNENWMLGQIAPLMSKKVGTDMGTFVPYAAIPFEFVNKKDENITGSQFVVGSELLHPETPDLRYGAEVGFELNKSYTYLSVYVSLPFDSAKGIGAGH